MRRFPLLFLLVGMSAACDASMHQHTTSPDDPPASTNVDEPRDPEDPENPEDPEDPAPRTSPDLARRLSPFEYKQSVRDIFEGADLGMNFERAFNANMPLYFQDGFYENDLSGLVISTSELQTLLEFSIMVSQYASDKGVREQVMGCALDSADSDQARAQNDACMDGFAQRLASKAFRRAPSQQELDAIRALRAQARSEGIGLREQVRVIIERVLLSPAFLYRLESVEGPAAPGDPLRVMLNGQEVATRLSYLLWGTTPDQALLEAAEAGALDSPEGVEAYAQTMMRLPDGTPHPRAAETFARFYRQWLGLYSLDRAPKNTIKARGAEYSLDDLWDELHAPLRQETELFMDHVLWNEPLGALISADYSFVNEQVAGLYGIEGVEGEAFVRATLPANERRGLLTHGSILGKTTDSPIKRGAYVVERLLCKELGSPPPDIIDSLPPRRPDQTERERLDYLTKTPACAGCHATMHGIGFGLMKYDEIARRKVPTEGQPELDVTGTITFLGNQPYDGAMELVDHLAQGAVLEQCLVRNFFRFAYGRHESELDRALLEDITDNASARTFEDIVLQMVRSVHFRSREAITQVDP